MLSAVTLLTAAGCSTQEKEPDSAPSTPDQTITQDTSDVSNPASDTTNSAPDTTNNAQDTTNSSSDATTPDSDSPEFDYVRAYDEILRSACELLYDVDNCEAVEGERGIWELAVGMEPADSFACLGYAIQDISGDDIPELLIGYIADDSEELRSKNIFAVYTCVDGAPSLVMEGWYRNAYYYLGDGKFLNTASESAMCSVFRTYIISPNGEELTCQDCYFTFEKESENPEIGFYHNKIGLTDPDISEELDITDDAFWSMEEELVLQAKNLALVPFSDYEAAQGYEYAAKMPIHVQWAEDAELPTDYDEYHISQSSESQSRLVFTTDTPVESFTILELTLVDVSENGNIEFDAYPATTQILDVRPERPVVVGLTFAGDLPCYGFQYEDENGDCRRFALVISGEDGSILVREADRESFNFVLEGSTD